MSVQMDSDEELEDSILLSCDCFSESDDESPQVEVTDRFKGSTYDRNMYMSSKMRSHTSINEIDEKKLFAEPMVSKRQM